MIIGGRGHLWTEKAELAERTTAWPLVLCARMTGRQAYQLIHSHIYPILFGLPQSTLDTFYLCHIFLRCDHVYWLALTFLLWGKALLTYISTYLHRLQLGQKWTHFDIMIQFVQCHIMEGVCPILGKKTRGIKSFLFLEASDTNICQVWHLLTDCGRFRTRPKWYFKHTGNEKWYGNTIKN